MFFSQSWTNKILLPMFVLAIMWSGFIYRTLQEPMMKVIIQIESVEDPTTLGRIFWHQERNGYSEDRSVAFFANGTPATAMVPTDSVVLRFDPGVVPGHYKVQKIELQSEWGLTIRQWQSDSQTFVDWRPTNHIDDFYVQNRVLQMFSTGNDPIVENFSVQEVLREWRERLLLFLMASLVVAIILLALICVLRGDWAKLKTKVPYVVALLFVQLGAGFAWNSIALPFHNSLGIIGILDRVKLNPATNLIRFIFFVGLTSFVLFFYVSFFSGKEKTPEMNAKLLLQKLSFLHFLSLAVVGAWAALSFLKSFPDGSVLHIDLFHHGDYLAPAIKWATEGKLWTGSFFTRGALYDAMTPVLGWKVFQLQNIASFLTAFHILNALPALSIGLLLGVTLYCLRQSARHTDILLLAVSMACLLWAAENVFFLLDFREILPTLGIAVLLLGVHRNKSGLLLFSGLLVFFIPSIDWFIFYFCICATTLAISVLLTDERIRVFKNQVLPFSLGVPLGLLILISFFGWNEVSQLPSQISGTLSHWPFIYSYEFPSPLNGKFVFSHTWPVWALSGLLLRFTFVFVSKKCDKDLLIVFFALLATALANFNTALGRADASHVLYASHFLVVALIFAFWEWVRHTNKEIKQLYVLGLVLVLANGIVSRLTSGTHLSFSEKLENLKVYVRLKDEAFISEETIKLLAFTRPLVENEKCFFLLSNQPALFYLLRKPSCGKFYFPVHGIGSDFEQIQIQDLEHANWVLESTLSNHVVDEISNRERFPLLSSEVDKDFHLYKTLGSWKIYRRIKLATSKGSS